MNRIFGYEPKIGLELLTNLGSAEALFGLDRDSLDELMGPFSKYRNLIRTEAVDAEAQQLARLANEGISFCGWTEDIYPELLKECEDPPIGLYVRTSTPLNELWKPCRRIAVVGTRDITPYGREWCERIVRSLSHTDARPTIVSGLALGTDITAHRTALESGLPTIGVMATGPEDVYPYRHKDFAKRLVATPGCALITDYPPGTAPVALNFLRRNRIIAGLGEATVLIESKFKGGGMMTCRLAASYNREVYALPGRADDARSQGCNDLIRRKIAEPITSERELIEGLGLTPLRKEAGTGFEARLTATYGSSLSRERLAMMATILRAIARNRGIVVDSLPNVTGICFRTVAELTGILEIDGFICIDMLRRCTIIYK